jgi:transketolase
MNWPVTDSFHVPPEVTQFFNSVKEVRLTDYQMWQEQFRAWSQHHPDLAKLLAEMQNKTLPDDFETALMAVIDESALATRAQSGKVIQKIAELLPGFCGGSADLAPSNNTLIKNARSISKADFSGRNLHFGIREHAMGAVLNGLALYDGYWLPYGGTFLVFSDYMRAAIRLAALMEQQVVYVFTHDSIFLGEDGPTHQAVEHYAALQLIPNLTVIRPADGVETAAAWIYALKNQTGPTALILSRQKLPPIHHPANFDVGKLAFGGFILVETEKPDLILAASGSEVHLAMAAKIILENQGHKVRVVSMPSLKLFKQQTKVYQQTVIPLVNCRVVAIEAGVTDLWPSVIGTDSLIIGVDRFGASAPAGVLAEKFGFTAQHIARRVLEWLK